MAVLKPFLPTKKEDKVLAAYKRWIEKKQSILVRAKKQMKTKKTIVKKCVIPPNDLTGIDLSKIKKFCTNGSCGCNSLKEKVQNPFSTNDIQRYYQELMSQQLAQQNQLQNQQNALGMIPNRSIELQSNVPQIGQVIPMPPQIGGLAQIQSITTGGTEANKPF